MTSLLTPTQTNSEKIHSNPAELLSRCETDSSYLKALKGINQRGRIELIMGTMFAGKSTELLRQISL